MISIRVHDFCGCARAAIVCDPIALVAGRNAAGKSSLAQAAAAVLTGETLAFDLANKASAGRLVRAGATEASVEIAAALDEPGKDGGGLARVHWPSCQATAQGDPPRASVYAAGLDNLLTMDAKARAQVLGKYLHADPDRDDLAAALHDRNEDYIAAVWKLICEHGWDSTHTMRRERGTQYKGQWRQITNQIWGSRVGASWRPPEWSLDLDNAHENDLLAAVALSKRDHQEAIGAAAVSASRREEMAAEAAELDARKDKLRDLEQAAEQIAGDLDKAKAEREALPPASSDSGTPCPACGVFLVWRRINVAESVLEEAATVPADELKRRRVAIAAADGRLSGLTGQCAAADRAVDTARARMQQAAEAKNHLGQLGPPAAGAAAADVANAEAALAAATARLTAWRQVVQARDIHQRIVDNDRLLDILAPEGLRAQKLSRVLDLFNRTLAQYCEAAEWAPVSVGPDLSLAYDGRTHPIATSEEYRIRAVLAVAMAKLDGSSMIILDAADVLDGTTRNGLAGLLDEAGLPALVCMTATRRDQVPDLDAAGLGKSYWIERGTAFELLPLPAEATA